MRLTAASGLSHARACVRVWGCPLGQRERGVTLVDSYTHGDTQAFPAKQPDLTCIECQRSVWPAGPVYTWLDDKVRCQSCKHSIETGARYTKVPDSPISEWYMIGRAILHARMVRRRAEAGEDYATIDRMGEILAACSVMCQEIIRKRMSNL